MAYTVNPVTTFFYGWERLKAHSVVRPMTMFLSEIKHGWVVSSGVPTCVWLTPQKGAWFV